MGFLTPKAPTIQMPAQAPPPPPQFQQQQKPVKRKPAAPTFLGQEATPEFAGGSMTGGKTLLGQ